MKNILLVISIILTLACGSVFAQTTEFTYQGSLKDGANPASGSYDFQFVLFDAGGALISGILSKNNVAVANGLFSVKLDFGNLFPGANRFLEIRVRQTGGGAFTVLAPRQQVTTSPYSITSLNATNAINATQLGGIAANQYLTTTSGNTSYIQNSTSPQTLSNFNISGTGTANIFRAEAQFNIGANRVLGNRCPNNLNVGIGAGAGEDVGCGISENTRNSFFGTNAGFSNVFGYDNVYVGFEAGRNSDSGRYNTFVGLRSGFSNGVGASNTYLGANAGNNGNPNSSANTFIGASTGLSNTMPAVGGLITILGYRADVSSGGFLNATAIGAYSQVSQSNSLVLGSIANVNGATADTNVGIGTTAPTFKLQVIDSSNTGLRVQTNALGGTVASFGGRGAFQIDAEGIVGGRLNVLENGNVGIGTATPTEKLSVNGKIQSTSGGYKFPDGTVQTAAANTTFTKRRTSTEPPIGIIGGGGTGGISSIMLMNVPAGTYLLSITVEFRNNVNYIGQNNNRRVTCRLSNLSDEIYSLDLPGLSRMTTTFQWTSTVTASADFNATVFCYHSGDFQNDIVEAATTRMTAVKVEGNLTMQ